MLPSLQSFLYCFRGVVSVKDLCHSRFSSCAHWMKPRPEHRSKALYFYQNL